MKKLFQIIALLLLSAVLIATTATIGEAGPILLITNAYLLLSGVSIAYLVNNIPRIVRLRAFIASFFTKIFAKPRDIHS